MQEKNNICQKIKQIRGSLTQSELAKKTGIHRAIINQAESGERKLSLASLEKLADYGGVSIDYLLGRPDVPTHKLTQEEENLIYSYRKLSVETQSIVIKLIEKLTEEKSSK